MIRWFVYVAAIIMCGQSVYAQEFTETKDTLVVIPGRDHGRPNVLKNVIDAVTEALNGLGRFVVSDRTEISTIMREQDFLLSDLADKNPVELGRFISANKVIIVNLGQYSSERKVSTTTTSTKTKDQKKDVTKDETKSKTTVWYESVVSASLKAVDLETAEVVNTFTLTGKGRGESEDGALDAGLSHLGTLVRSEARRLYPLRLRILEKRGNTVVLAGGRNLGIVKNAEYRILRPGRTKTFGGKSYEITGDKIGLVRIVRVENDLSYAMILRGFNAIGEKHYAKERLKGLDGGALFDLLFKPDGSSYFIQVFLEPDAYTPNTGLFYFGLGSAKDNRDGDLSQMRFGIYGHQKFLRTQWVDLGVREEIGLFRAGGAKDDSSNVLDRQWRWQGSATAFLNVYIKDNLVVFGSASYQTVLGGKLDNWEYQESITVTNQDNEEIKKKKKRSAYWDPAKGERTLDPNAVFVSLGIKFVW